MSVGSVWILGQLVVVQQGRLWSALVQALVLVLVQVLLLIPIPVPGELVNVRPAQTLATRVSQATPPHDPSQPA